MNKESKRNIGFSPPDITNIEIENVVEVLKSGWITTGPKTKQLEKELANYIGTNKVACLNSQTACGETALRLLGIGQGDEVITCAYTYTATAAVIEHVGAKIVLVDCQNNSLEMDYEALENAITEKTKAIIPVDIAGICCDYTKIFDIVERKKYLFKAHSNTELGQKIQESFGRIIVISDSAHALGASIKVAGKTKMAGTIADFTTYSFHAVKNFTTAEGGAITWRTIPDIEDEQIYRQIQLYSLHGQNKDALEKNKNGTWEYDIAGPWYKCNMTDIMAAIGLGQLSRYPALLNKRKQIIEKYNKAFIPLGIEVLPHFTENKSSSGHLYLTRIPNITIDERNLIIEEMAKRGISCNVHYKPLPMMTAYKKFGFDISDFPNAYKHFANEITLPLHTKLSEEDVEYIIENYVDVLKEFM